MADREALLTLASSQLGVPVSDLTVGKGVTGPITRAIQKEFYAIVKGEKADRHHWLTPVPVRSKQPVSV